MNDLVKSERPRKGKFSSYRMSAKKFSVVGSLSERCTPKTSVWDSKKVSFLKAAITGKLPAEEPVEPVATKPKRNRRERSRNRRSHNNRRGRKNKAKGRAHSAQAGSVTPLPMSKPTTKEGKSETKPERSMSVTAVLGGRARSGSDESQSTLYRSESEYSRITNKEFPDTVVGEPLVEERRSWGSINESWEDDLPPEAVADMPDVTPTESMLLPSFKPLSLSPSSLSLTDTSAGSSVSTIGSVTVVSPAPTAPAVDQPTMMHMIPDMMVLPCEPMHGQRMMVPAVYDANHRCFVLSVNQAADMQPVMAPGYQFVYPAIQAAPQPWGYPQMQYGQYQTEG